MLLNLGKQHSKNYFLLFCHSTNFSKFLIDLRCYYSPVCPPVRKCTMQIVSVLAGINPTFVTVGAPDSHKQPEPSFLLWRHQHCGAGA